MFNEKEYYLLKKIVEKIENIQSVFSHYDASINKAL